MAKPISEAPASTPTAVSATKGPALSPSRHTERVNQATSANWPPNSAADTMTWATLNVLLT